VTLSPDALARIEALTLAHYDEHAETFWLGTRDHDVSQNVAAFLSHIEGAAPFAILDLGCGPGRDLATFSRLGHHAVGLDGAPRFVAMARAHSGCDVWQQSLLALSLPPERFDGVFANAVLFHVPAQELPRVLRELRATLKPRGVLFSSNPRGQGQECWTAGRYGHFHDLTSWRAAMATAGFVELDHYYRPAGLPCDEQPWLASVWQRIDPGPRRP